MAATAVAASGAALPLGRWLFERPSVFREGPFGRLRPDPARTLDLLEGFRYRVLERSGAWMSDGHRVPARPDGMACFEVSDGSLVLMRNHELPGGLAARYYGLPNVREAFDRSSSGAVTRVVLDAHTLRRRSSNLVLAWTNLNCSGGPSPWGWLSCEENVDRGHGFVFLCDPSADSVRAPRPIAGYGRFRHEAAAVDPSNAIAYLSEDLTDGCLYRFVPHDPSSPFEGRLQALRVRGRRAAHTRTMRAGERREIDWVDVRETAPEENVLRHRAHELGAASFARGEGIAFGGGALYVSASIGGANGTGQIFKIADEGDGGTLEVFACSSDRSRIDMPDNVCIAPSGSLYFVEDGGGHDYVRGVTSDGEPFDLARNAKGEGELCGVCFSPDGRAMFVNLQDEGLTIAIQGPFDRLVVAS